MPIIFKTVSRGCQDNGRSEELMDESLKAQPAFKFTILKNDLSKIEYGFEVSDQASFYDRSLPFQTDTLSSKEMSVLLQKSIRPDARQSHTQSRFHYKQSESDPFFEETILTLGSFEFHCVSPAISFAELYFWPLSSGTGDVVE
jgi:hypothetical protein